MQMADTDYSDLAVAAAESLITYSDPGRGPPTRNTPADKRPGP
jgi:hypothetical protein